MLQNIHDKAKGWVAYLIVGFIAIPFTLFGISSYLGGGSSLVAAVVNGEEIPVQDVQNAVLQQRQRLAQLFGGKLPPGFDENTIKRQALEQIVAQTLLRQESKDYGYRASNQEVYDTIAAIPAFQVNGRFDPKQYERLLASQRRNKATFESEVRDSLSNQQFSEAITKAAFLPSKEMQRYASLQNQTRSAKTYTLRKQDYADNVSVSDKEISDYYQKNQEKFNTPEQVKLSYLVLKQDDLAKSVPVDEEGLRAFYEENADRYADPEQRKLAHILVKVDMKGANGDIKKAEEKALKKAQSLYETIQSGKKSFTELAKTASDDVYTAKKAGEIGLIAKGDMGPLFEKAAFALNKGEVSQPVKAEAGYEIIKLLDIVSATQKPYSEVKDQIEKAYRAEEAEKKFLDDSDKLQTLAFENDSSLDAAAEAVGMKVQTSNWLSRSPVTSNRNDITSSPKVIAAAFSDDVLKQGKNSDLIEINDGTVAVVRLQEHQPAKPRPLTDVKEEIKKILSDAKLRKLLIEKGEQALSKLRETEDWQAALQIIGASVDKVEALNNLKRTDKKVAPVLLRKIFSMKKPDADKDSYDSVILPEGDYVLIDLLKVVEGNIANPAPDLLATYANMLGSREQAAVLKSLREQADVKLMPENLQ